MATIYAHRVLILIPASRRAATIAWWDANLDAGQGAATWNVGLNASGNPLDPITHYWASIAQTAVELAKLVQRLCNVSGITPPANWQNLTRQQQLTWLSTNLPTVLANSGIAVVRDDNDGAWSRADDLLASLGLQRLRPTSTGGA